LEDFEPKKTLSLKKSGHNPDNNRKTSSIKLNHEHRKILTSAEVNFYV